MVSFLSLPGSTISAIVWIDLQPGRIRHETHHTVNETYIFDLWRAVMCLVLSTLPKMQKKKTAQTNQLGTCG